MLEVFSATDQFDPMAMQAFMRRPDIYWPTVDSMAPAPEQTDFVSHLLHPCTWTVAAMWTGDIIGYVVFVQRTSVLAEINLAFHPQARGKIARNFTQYAIGRAFTERGFLKLVALVPSDNRAAIIGAYHLHFRLEGRVRNGIMRNGSLRDLLVLGLEKGNGYQQGT